DVSNAGGRAVFQMRIKAMLVIALARCQRPAAAEMILPPDQGERAAQGAGTGEGAEITRAIILLETGKRKPRNGVVQIHLQHEEAFVIAKADVVARMKFFDQLAFEQESFRLAPDDVAIEIVNRFDQRLEFEVPA